MPVPFFIPSDLLHHPYLHQLSSPTFTSIIVTHIYILITPIHNNMKYELEIHACSSPSPFQARQIIHEFARPKLILYETTQMSRLQLFILFGLKYNHKSEVNVTAALNRRFIYSQNFCMSKIQLTKHQNSTKTKRQM